MYIVSKMGHQRKPKSVPKLDPKGNASGKRFLSYYNGFLPPKWVPKSIKELSKNGFKKGASKKRLVEASGDVLGASWGTVVRKRAENINKPDLTWNGKRRSFWRPPAEGLWNDLGPKIVPKFLNVSLALLAALGIPFCVFACDCLLILIRTMSRPPA